MDFQKQTDTNTAGVIVPQREGVIYESVAHPLPSFFSKYTNNPIEGLLTLYDNGQVVFVCLDTSLNTDFYLTDIKQVKFVANRIRFELNDEKTLWVRLPIFQPISPERAALIADQSQRDDAHAIIGTLWREAFPQYLPADKVVTGKDMDVLAGAIFGVILVGVVIVVVTLTSG